MVPSVSSFQVSLNCLTARILFCTPAHFPLRSKAALYPLPSSAALLSSKGRHTSGGAQLESTHFKRRPSGRSYRDRVVVGAEGSCKKSLTLASPVLHCLKLDSADQQLGA